VHPLYEYVATQLAEKVRSRGLVVWYDERSEFAPFVAEMCSSELSKCTPVDVLLLNQPVNLVHYTGSMFELRTAVEPFVAGVVPRPTVLYISGYRRDRRSSVLMEYEKAGVTWEPDLKQLARNVLLGKYTLGVVDDMLPFDRKASYVDISLALSENNSSEAPSILRSIYHGARSNEEILAAWLASDQRDEIVRNKEAMSELKKLISARLGIDLEEDITLQKIRAVTLRYVLANEFRLDLTFAAPSSLEGVQIPKTKDNETAIRELARFMRGKFAESYSILANRVEEELGLRNFKIPPGSLGTIDTFRFEELAILGHAGDLIVTAKFEEALSLVSERENSFWLEHDVGRKAHWEAVRLMAELGVLATNVRVDAQKANGNPVVWLNSYTTKGGWYRLDQAQRRLEALVANLDSEPEEKPLAVARKYYEDTCHAMAEGFTRALVKDGWSIPGSLHQTAIYTEIVAERPKPVAYFLVDAMRFEMGMELADRLPNTSEVTVRPAITALPSITPMGMAALMPGASSSYTVVEKSGKLGAKVDGVFLPDLANRKKFAAARVPKLVDISLDELLSLQLSKVKKKVENAQVVVVRSQEIDHAGETGFSFQARQVMDSVIDNLARALRKLATAGIEHAVVTADHGHLFFANDRDESMRTDAPGGDTVELHRRCWIGRGGSTPPGCTRVAASTLGYDSDLEMIFPIGSGVFRAGGDLAFHHGGPSLQEIVVPVLTVRTMISGAVNQPDGPVFVGGYPEIVTNRIFSVTMSYGTQQRDVFAEDIFVRPLLTTAGKRVGAVGMAVDAEFDRSTGCVKLQPSKPVTVAFILSDESVESLRIVVQDPATDAELYRSPKDISVRLGV